MHECIMSKVKMIFQCNYQVWDCKDKLIHWHLWKLSSILQWSVCFHHSIQLKLNKTKELNCLELLFNSINLFQNHKLESCQYDLSLQRRMISSKVCASSWNTGKYLKMLKLLLGFSQHQSIQKYDQRSKDLL